MTFLQVFGFGQNHFRFVLQYTARSDNKNKKYFIVDIKMGTLKCDIITI